MLFIPRALRTQPQVRGCGFTTFGCLGESELGCTAAVATDTGTSNIKPVINVTSLFLIVSSPPSVDNFERDGTGVQLRGRSSVRHVQCEGGDTASGSGESSIMGARSLRPRERRGAVAARTSSRRCWLGPALIAAELRRERWGG